MRKWTLALLLVATAACSPPASPPDNRPVGLWRGEINHFGKTLPFNFEIRASGDDLAVDYLNGPERLPVETVSWTEAGELLLDFPSYSSGLAAQVDGDNMQGQIRLQRRSKLHQLDFVARRGPAHRFFAEPTDEYQDFSGRWQVEIYVPAFDFRQPAVALFEQAGAAVSGTVMTEVGDYRFLAGEARGDTLYLSAFDGGGTQRWQATMDADGSLRGEFDSVTYQAAQWTATRNADYRLRDPQTLTALKPGYDSIDFTFPNLEGQPVSLSDERFAGQVVLVVLGGSWCPTCHDEAEFMGPFYAARAEQGLEVVYLMFEYSDQLDEVADQLRAYRDRYDIRHPILFAGDAAREGRNSLLPMLNNIMAFPTTIFVDRRGKVRRIHTAFPGPATGQEHLDYTREFAAFVDLLLGESA